MCVEGISHYNHEEPLQSFICPVILSASEE